MEHLTNAFLCTARWIRWLQSDDPGLEASTRTLRHLNEDIKALAQATRLFWDIADTSKIDCPLGEEAERQARVYEAAQIRLSSLAEEVWARQKEVARRAGGST